MSKLKLIIVREYLTRVKNKTFLLATFLAPLGMLLYFAVIALVFSYKSDDVKHVLVVDKTGAFSQVLQSNNLLAFDFSTEEIKTLLGRFDSIGVNGILYLPKPNVKSKDYTVYYYSHEPLDMAGSVMLQSALKKGLRKHKIKALDLDPQLIEMLNSSVSIDPEPVNEGEKDSGGVMAVGIATGIGTVIGMVMFMIVMVYGMMVMRSVMEEKVNRIVELIISSVKPIELMMGKIIGVGLVGLTQLGIWMLTVPLIMLIAQFFFMPKVDAATLEQVAGKGAADPEEITNQVYELLQVVGDMNWWVILPLVILFFLGGYLLYSSLYAAVGSAIGEDMGEAQSLTLPISIPLILAFYIMFMAVQAPNSTLAVVASLIPFFSPIVMPARLFFNPPAWQILLSIVLLLVTIYFMVWLSAKIYRVGILMYGKKTSLKEIAKWVFS